MVAAVPSTTARSSRAGGEREEPWHRLQDPWSRRHHLLAWAAKERTTSASALAEHLRSAASA